jgi:hypothetical protein
MAHDVADLCIGSLSFGDAADRNVTVRNHADQLVMLADWQNPNIQCLHSRRRIPKGLVGAYNLDVTVHDLADFHAGSIKVLLLRESQRFIN